MRGGIALAVCFSALVLGGCRTIQDINYNIGHTAAEEGRDVDAYKRFSSVAAADGYDGQSSARYRLAEMYMEGRGTTKNVRKALELYQQVADGDDRSWRRLALVALANLHERGIEGHIEKDLIKAAEYFNLAAKDGYQIGTRGLERLLEHPEVFVHFNPDEFTKSSTGVAPAGIAAAFKQFESGNKQTAYEIFLWHARNGNEQAQATLATFYKEGIIVPKNSGKYTGWAWLAAKNGSAKAQLEMGLLYYQSEFVSGSDSVAEYWFGLASRQGLAEATNWLGILNAHPLDKDRKANWPLAVRYFQEAADAGSLFAMVNLGDAHLEGKGAIRDPERAKQLYQKAADAGSVLAKRKLIELGVAALPTSNQDRRPEPQRSDSGSSATPQTKTSKQAQEPIPAPTQSKPSPVEVFSSASPTVFKLVALKASDEKSGSQGSAVAIAENTAITNCHVIEGKDLFGAKFGNDVMLFKRGRTDSKKDICLIHSEKKLKFVQQIRAYSDLKVGEKVYAIGSPRSLENTLSEGIISGLRTDDGVRYVQTTASITNGSSGGGLFDEAGRLIGITTFGLKGSGNLNFAVAIDDAMEAVNARR